MFDGHIALGVVDFPDLSSRSELCFLTFSSHEVGRSVVVVNIQTAPSAGRNGVRDGRGRVVNTAATRVRPKAGSSSAYGGPITRVLSPCRRPIAWIYSACGGAIAWIRPPRRRSIAWIYSACGGAIAWIHSPRRRSIAWIYSACGGSIARSYSPWIRSIDRRGSSSRRWRRRWPRRGGRSCLRGGSGGWGRRIVVLPLSAPGERRRDYQCPKYRRLFQYSSVQHVCAPHDLLFV